MRASTSFSLLSRFAVVLMLVLFVATTAYAQFTPSDDSYVNSKAATTNYGAAKTLDLSSAGETTFIRFDLTAVPSGYTGSSIAKATLKLYVNTVTTAGSFNVDLVNGTWTEGAIDYSNAPALGTTIAASVPLATSNKLDYVSIDITPAVVEWLSGTANDGIALVANSPLVATLDSKESTTTSHSAELDIVFTGGGGAITGVLTGAGSGLTGGGTSGTLNLSLINTCAANQTLQWNGTGWACASAGTGTITGVTAGTDLTGGGISGNVTLNLNTSLVPQLNTANTFTGNQTVNGNLSATGVVSGSAYQIGSNLFAFGSYANANAFLGFAGNTTMTGLNNVANGYQALVANATGGDNTASGTGALASNTAGSYNTASGYAALHSNTQGNWNTASGYGALSNNTTGSDNTASGTGALGSNTLGTENVAVGDNALLINVGDSAGDGWYNTAVGVEALWWNNSTSGSGSNASYNAALGYQALASNTTGSNNTASGAQALQYNTTGSNNTALGYGAGPDKNSTALVNSVAIGANAVVSESNALVLGGTGSNAVNVGIGTATPAYALDVHGTGNFTGLVNFASGQQFPGAGTITGVTAGTALTGGGTSGNVTLNVNTTQVVTGVTAGTDLTGGGTGGNVTLNLNTANVPLLAAANTFTGSQTVNGSLSASQWVSGAGFEINGFPFAWGLGGGNAFFGDAGNLFTTGSYDTATGYAALGANTSGSYNAVTGDYALFENTSGSYNTADGYEALGANTSGDYNAADGYQALSYNTTGYNNTADGYQALYYNTQGTANTAIGEAALYNNTGGSNTAVGGAALYNNVTGTNNTALGAGAGVAYDTTNLTNATAIGAGAVVTESNALVLGNGANVGIGTTAPQYTLDVAGNVRITGSLSKGSGSFQIDHPLDPANKYLYHSFVESPDMMNIYNGNVILDRDGTAWIALPDYFGALNRDFRYQLTAVGAPGPNLYIAQEIANNRFQIAGGTPGGKVSWQVTGIRQDDFAKAHPIIPEVEKTGDERGAYLHPVEHGLPKSMGIDENRRAKMEALHPMEPPKPPERAALPEPPKLAPPKLPQQQPAPTPPRTKPAVPQLHVAVPEPPK